MNDEFDIKRSAGQNRKMWPMLTDIAKQKPWPHTKRGNWVIGLMTPKSWKSVLTAAFEGELEMAQGIGGGTVMVGASTSNYGMRKFGDLIEFLYSQGAEWGIAWSEKSQRNFADVRAALAARGRKAA
jgi:hypothetical protein